MKNATRRKIIEAAASAIDQATRDLQQVREDEQSAFDNLPESLQGGEQGAKMEEGLSELDDAINNLESASESLGNLNAS